MIDVKKLLTMILTRITTTVSYVESSQQTLNGNTNLNNLSFSVAKSGYTPIGIVGFSVEWVQGETALVNVYKQNLSGSSALVSVRNTGANQVKFKIRLYILYRKVWGGTS